MADWDTIWINANLATMAGTGMPVRSKTAHRCQMRPYCLADRWMPDWQTGYPGQRCRRTSLQMDHRTDRLPYASGIRRQPANSNSVCRASATRNVPHLAAGSSRL